MDGNQTDVEVAAAPPLEPEDYYFEGGNIVFTAEYHLKRGCCCGSGCRHCPYGLAGVMSDAEANSVQGAVPPADGEVPPTTG
jgi:hypothetical protein